MIHSIVQWIVRVFILFCIFSLSGCAVFESKSISDCHFKYTDDIKKEVIVPFLTEKVSRGMVKYFNVDKPVISEKKDKTRVVLSAINSVNGQMVMFENSYVFVFTTCEQLLVESFEVIRN